MTQGGLGESLQKQENQGMSHGQLDGRMHLDHLRTSHCLLLADCEKACLDNALGELQALKKMVQLGKKRDLQAAGLELLQVGNGQGTAQELQGWMGNALGLLGQVDIVQVFQDQGGNHHIVLVPQDQSGKGSALVLLGQMTHQDTHWEQRAGWELQGLNQAILGLQQVGYCWQGQTGWCVLFSLSGLGCHLLRHQPAKVQQKGK